MQLIHKILIFLKIIVILSIFLVTTKIITKDKPIIIFFESTFKLMLSLFVMFITLPNRKKIYPLCKEDLLFLFACGFILFINIDYKSYFQNINIILKKINNYYKNKYFTK